MSLVDGRTQGDAPTLCPMFLWAAFIRFEGEMPRYDGDCDGWLPRRGASVRLRVRGHPGVGRVPGRFLLEQDALPHDGGLLQRVFDRSRQCVLPRRRGW